ncbi:MAG: IclR family transcriptional regulator [Rhodospirillales bacterium]|jgi:DNA-binding IclR family transcriptional regulator|nr:IclR family transcriptional regulator [Rhodospirillales bacterium]
MGEETNQRYVINSIMRASTILQCLAREDAGMKVGEIAKRLDLDRTTVFRLIVTLEECGYVEKILNTKEYKLGVGIFEVGSAYIRSTDLHSAARPMMIGLSRRVREAVHWAILSGEKAVCIDKIDSPRGLGTTSKIGRAASLNAGSVGKVLLAFQPDGVRDHLLATMDFPRLTEQTITTPEHMREVTDEIRRAGYCISLGEGDSDMACIAAPIFDHTGQMVAGISVGGPIHRFTDTESANFIREELLKVAHQISEIMGCREVPAFENAA